MPSIDNRPRDMFDPAPELKQHAEPVPDEQNTSSIQPSTTQQWPAQKTGQFPIPGMKQPAVQPNPNTTRVLPAITRVLPGEAPGMSENTTTRVPVVIKGEMKKPLPPAVPIQPHPKRRLIVNLIAMAIICLAMILTLFSVTPLGHDLNLNLNPLEAGNNLIRDMNSNPPNLVAQATATAIFHQRSDGYDPSSNGGQTYGNGAGSLAWPYGQCTYWANLEYHRKTGFWVSWSGNADQWVAGARGAGWIVSQTPHVYSIIVLMPGVQGASGYGHVAVVESMVNSTTVHTSNMNWYTNGGGFGVVSYQDFTTGSGVYFIWHP